MKKFLFSLAVFMIISCIAGEIIIRIFRLTPDTPERYIDAAGIQRYKHNQSGYYTRATYKWLVNSFGWLGVCDTAKDTIVSVVGDSYIENIMNPISCNQGTLLKSYFPNFSFFEAGRSGVSFIEAMEITKDLDSEIKPKIHLLYISNKDFYESISNIERIKSIVQIDLKEQNILRSDLSLSGVKKLLYRSKLLYYLYLHFSISPSKQNLTGLPADDEKINAFDNTTFNSLFEYCSKHYNHEKIVFVFHPGIQKEFVTLAEKYQFKTICLNSGNDKSWVISNNDDHWSCYGHEQIAKQIQRNLLKCFVR